MCIRDRLTVSSIWDARLAAELKPLGLTTRKYALLGHIGGSPDISFSELARRSLITVQSVHAAVGSLATAGLVEDATAHAGAASALRVTDAGERALERANAILVGLDASFAERAPALAASLAGLHEEPGDAAPDDPGANIQAS